MAFSPRKAAISLYVFSGNPEHEHLLKDLGKFTMGKGCIYVKKLSDIDLEALQAKGTVLFAFLYLNSIIWYNFPGRWELCLGKLEFKAQQDTIM